MSTHQIIHSLHFRMATLFLVLLAVMFLGYTKWVDRTLYGVSWAPGEQEWYDEFRDTEMDSLASLISPRFHDRDFLEASLERYGRNIERYDAEMAVIAADGRVILTTAPDTLSEVLIRISPVLLDSMSLDDWDFSSYPDPYDISSYVNRITAVSPMHSDGDTLTAAVGWLISTFRPVNADLTDTKRDDRIRLFQGAAVVLIYSFVIGLILLAWVSRRIGQLATDMALFRDGDFSQRTHLSGSDEIAALGDGFNRLADRLSSVIGELRQSEAYRSQLVANISHDLRTPMATLRSYIESFMLRWESLPAEDRNRQLARITSNLDNLEGLIERLLGDLGLVPVLQVHQLFDHGQVRILLDGQRQQLCRRSRLPGQGLRRRGRRLDDRLDDLSLRRRPFLVNGVNGVIPVNHVPVLFLLRHRSLNN